MFTLRTKVSIARALITKQAPYYIQFYINGRCNFKCKQCNIVETNSGIGELSVEQIRQVAKNIRLIGGGIVLLTGGEPFLRRDIHLVAKSFLDEGLNVRLQTAGQATKEQLKACYDVGCRDINISLDSLVADKQDFVNTVPGSWNKAIAAIARVSQVFCDDAAICGIGCVLSRLNFREIPAILQMVTEIGWYLSLVPVHIARKGEKFGFRSYEQLFSFSQEDIPELRVTLQQLIEMKRQGYTLFDAESYLWSALDFLQGYPPTWRRFNSGRCDSPNLYFAVRPNGEFSTCCDYVLNEKFFLTDPDFWRRYRDGIIHRVAAPIVDTCPGCHYGSYPEVSLSVRDVKALKDRFILLFCRKRRSSLTKKTHDELLAQCEEIRRGYPEVYDSDVWMTSEARWRLEQWKTPNMLRSLIEEDRATRRAEGRLRKSSLHGDGT